MKRICLLGAAIAGLSIIGVASAPAATRHAATATAGGQKKPSLSKAATSTVACTSSLSVQVPDGDSTVTQGATDGTQFGPTKCDKSLGSGAEWETFSTDTTGTISGKWQQWFNAGTVYGAYMLTPTDDSPPTTTSFTSASYTGTLTVKGGSGADKKATGKGTLRCTTTDSVHFACTSRAKLILPAPAS